MGAFKNYNTEAALKGITQSVKSYGKMQNERAKMVSGLIESGLKSQSNWLWKQKELDYQTPYQKQLGEQFKQQQTQTAPDDVFSAPVQPQIRQGEKGYTVHTPSIKEYIAESIRRKPEDQRSKKESKYLEEYLGLGSSYSKDFDTDFRATVSSGIDNPEQMDELIKKLKLTYPRRFTYNHEDNIRDIISDYAVNVEEAENTPEKKESWLNKVFSKGVDGAIKLIGGNKTPNMSAENRFKELMKTMSEEQAYKQLLKEKY